MTITTSQIIHDVTQADGTRKVLTEFTFHTGEVVRRHIRVDSGWDSVSGLASLVPIMEGKMIDHEVRSLIRQSMNSTIDPVDTEPQHPETDTAFVRRRRFHRHLVRFLMRHSDLRHVRNALYPIWYYLKFESGYTAQQIADYFDVTLAVLSRIDTRMQRFHDNLDIFDDAEDQID